MLISISEGYFNIGSLWSLTVPLPVTLGTTNLIFTQIGTMVSGAVSMDITVDWGNVPKLSKQFTVTIPGVSVGQRISCLPSGETPSGVYFDEHEFGVVMYVGIVTGTNTAQLLGSSTSAISGQRKVQVTSGVNTTIISNSGMPTVPSFVLQENNII
jgi:hypothetical protein